MRQKKTFRRGQLVGIVVIGIGYALSGRHVFPGSAGRELSAAQAIALRFPHDWDDAFPANGLPELPATANVIAPDTAGNAQFALLSPEPMMSRLPAPAIQPPQRATQAVAPQEAASARVSSTVARSQPAAVAVAPVRPSKPAVAAVRHGVNRPGHLLDDAQIASIKQRLHLTPDQEEMWPAVEAALRNIAYAKAREARRRGSATVQSASTIDPDSAEVQGLKSAAVPLIMSFNYEQKEEVRNLAHTMGLDQLASQF